jgi:hypothetical protein
MTGRRWRPCSPKSASDTTRVALKLWANLELGSQLSVHSASLVRVKLLKKKKKKCGDACCADVLRCDKYTGHTKLSIYLSISLSLSLSLIYCLSSIYPPIYLSIYLPLLPFIHILFKVTFQWLFKLILLLFSNKGASWTISRYLERSELGSDPVRKTKHLTISVLTYSA